MRRAREALSPRDTRALTVARWCGRISFLVGLLGVVFAALGTVFLALLIPDLARGADKWDFLLLFAGGVLASTVAGALTILGRARIRDGIAQDRAQVFTGLAWCVLGNAVALLAIAGYGLFIEWMQGPPPPGFPPRTPPSVLEMLLAAAPCMAVPGLGGALGAWALIAYGTRYRALGRPWQRGGAEPIPPEAAGL